METSPAIDVGAFFADRGFGARMGFGKRPGLIVVDMLTAFTDPSMPLGADQDAEIAMIRRLVDGFRAAGAPVIFLGVSYEEKDCADAGLWRLKNHGVATLAHDSRGTALDPRLERRDDEPLLYRRYPSGFFGTDLATRLTTREVDTAVIVGCTTSGCIRATAVDALQYGFRPMVVLDAVADRSRAAHDQSLFDIQAKYGDVVSTDGVLEELKTSRDQAVAS